MPLWNLGMSLGQFVMAGGWLLAADLPGRVKRLIREPFFWWISGLFFLHLIGLWNTEDMTYAMKDIRVKLPLLLMALMFAGAPDLTSREYRSVFGALLTGILVSTGYGFAMAAGLTPHPVNDYRDYSHFISHIRLSLLIDVCIVWMVLLRGNGTGSIHRWLFLFLFVWLVSYLLLIQSVTGIAILAILGLLYIIQQAIEKRRPAYTRFAAAAVLLFLSTGAFTYYYIFVDSIHYVSFHPHPDTVKTARGGTYVCNLQRQDLEEGRLVWENFCEGEINQAWHLRTGKSIWDSDTLQQMYFVSVLRYLTALQLTKDYDGVMALSDKDIRNILSGKATPFEDRQRNNPLQRIHDLANEYRTWYYTGWANGQSMVQRFEYLKAAKWILSRHLLTGVGTGDLPSAYDEAYNAQHSSLQPGWRLRAHNQYMSFGVAFGVPGMIYLIFVLAWLLVYAIRHRLHLFFAFLVIAAISFLNEDTLETQAGVTFFAFLCGWLWRYEKQEIQQDQY